MGGGALAPPPPPGGMGGGGGGGFAFGGTRAGRRGFYRGGGHFGPRRRRRPFYPYYDYYPWYSYYPYWYYPWYYYTQPSFEQHPATPLDTFGTSNLTPEQARRYCNVIYAPYCEGNAATEYCRVYAPLCINRIGPPPGVAGPGAHAVYSSRPFGNLLSEYPGYVAGRVAANSPATINNSPYPWETVADTWDVGDPGRRATLVFMGRAYPDVPEPKLPLPTMGEGWVIHNGEWMLRSHRAGVPTSEPFRPNF